jgi:hypothetical protein
LEAAREAVAPKPREDDIGAPAPLPEPGVDFRSWNGHGCERAGLLLLGANMSQRSQIYER